MTSEVGKFPFNVQETQNGYACQIPGKNSYFKTKCVLVLQSNGLTLLSLSYTKAKGTNTSLDPNI